MAIKAEHGRLAQCRDGDPAWRRRGPYLWELQWGTVREDYSAFGWFGKAAPSTAIEAMSWVRYCSVRGARSTSSRTGGGQAFSAGPRSAAGLLAYCVATNSSIG
jgi:hypothetical protein